MIFVEFKHLCGGVSFQSFAFFADATIDEALEVQNFFNKMRNHKY